MTINKLQDGKNRSRSREGEYTGPETGCTVVRWVAVPEVDCTVVVVSKVGCSRGRGSGSGSECDVTQLIPTGMRLTLKVAAQSSATFQLVLSHNLLRDENCNSCMQLRCCSTYHRHIKVHLSWIKMISV